MFGRLLLFLIAIAMTIWMVPEDGLAQCPGGVCYVQVAMEADPVVIESQPGIVGRFFVHRQNVAITKVDPVRTVVRAQPVRAVIRAVSVRAPVRTAVRCVAGRRIFPLCE